MNRQTMRLRFGASLPYDRSSHNVALPTSPENVSNATGAAVTLDAETGNVTFPGNMYADDIISILGESFASRPNAHTPGTVDGDTYTTLKALLLVFESAAWKKHGYSNSDPSLAKSNVTHALTHAPTVEQVTQAYANALKELQSRG
jgi:hypothetical protein